MYPYLSPKETTDHEKIAFQHTRELFVDFENLIPEKVLVVKSTKVGPSDDDLECLGGPSSLCFLDKENRVGMYLGSQVTQPCHFLLNTSVGVLLLVICNDKLFPSEFSWNTLSGNIEMSQTVSKLLHTIIFSLLLLNLTLLKLKLCAVHFIYICSVHSDT